MSGLGGAQGLDGGEHIGQKDVGQEEIVDGVAGQAQLGEGGQADAVIGQGPGLFDDDGGIGGRVGRYHRQGGGGDAGEALVIGGEELDIGHGAAHGVIHDLIHGIIHSLGHRADPPIDGAFLRGLPRLVSHSQRDSRASKAPVWIEAHPAAWKAPEQ